MAAIVYLDVEDEITSAASRIRSAEENRVALVVPYGSRLPEVPKALAGEAFWKRLSFARPPEVTVMSPDQVETITDATELLVDQQDVTPLGLAYQAIELQTSEDALDVALRRVLRAMKV